MKNNSFQPRQTAVRIGVSTCVALLIASALSVAGCSKSIEKAEEVRSVRAIKLVSSNVDVDAEFAGEVRARVESRLGFRVGGKIISRQVDVGNMVKRGQVLMRLDPNDLQLAQEQAVAGLEASESTRDLARSEMKRYQNLRDKNFVSQAVLEGKQAAFRAAQASYEQALAVHKSQSNQTGYSLLVADADGVVTGLDAEVGQVVTAGSPVVRVARLGEKEIVIGIPEDKVEMVRGVTDVKVRIWAHPDDLILGKIREISPIADPATRTFPAKVSIPDAPGDTLLGMTAYVIFSSKTAASWIKVPLTALFQDKGASAVWIVENNVVRERPVTIGAPSGNDILLTGGVASGQAVVTAGVNSLISGQRVRILGEESATDGAVSAAVPRGAAK